MVAKYFGVLLSVLIVVSRNKTRGKVIYIVALVVAVIVLEQLYRLSYMTNESLFSFKSCCILALIYAIVIIVILIKQRIIRKRKKY